MDRRDFFRQMFTVAAGGAVATLPADVPAPSEFERGVTHDFGTHPMEFQIYKGATEQLARLRARFTA